MESKKFSWKNPKFYSGENIVYAFILYSAVKTLEMRYENKMEKLDDEAKKQDEWSHFYGSVLIIYATEKYYGIFSAVRYANL